jgi:hypothetical protein
MNCDHQRAYADETGPAGGSYVAHCPDCGATSREATTPREALADLPPSGMECPRCGEDPCVCL